MSFNNFSFLVFEPKCANTPKLHTTGISSVLFVFYSKVGTRVLCRNCHDGKKYYLKWHKIHSNWKNPFSFYVVQWLPSKS